MSGGKNNNVEMTTWVGEQKVNNRLNTLNFTGMVGYKCALLLRYGAPGEQNKN